MLTMQLNISFVKIENTADLRLVPKRLHHLVQGASEILTFYNCLYFL